MSGILLASYFALWVVVLVLAVAVLALGRQIGLLHYRLPPSVARMGSPGPKVGEVVPPLEERDLSGAEVTLGSNRGKNTLLVFLTSGCEACDEVAPGVRSVAKSERAHTETIIVALEAPETFDRSFLTRHKLDDLPVIVSYDVGDDLGVPAAPYALLVDAEGVLRTKGTVNNLDQLISLFNAIETGHPSFDSYMRATHAHHVNEEHPVVADA